MSKSEIDKIKAVLSEMNRNYDYEELYNGSVNRTDKSTHAEYAKDKIKQISEILESK